MFHVKHFIGARKIIAKIIVAITLVKIVVAIIAVEIIIESIKNNCVNNTNNKRYSINKKFRKTTTKKILGKKI